MAEPEVNRVRDPETLGPMECWLLLGQSEVGRLAVAIRNRPDIFPVNYAVDGESIVINTAPGTKLAAAVLGRSVAFEVDLIDPEDVHDDERSGDFRRFTQVSGADVGSHIRKHALGRSGDGPK